MYRILVLICIFLLGTYQAYCQDSSQFSSGSGCQCAISKTLRKGDQFLLEFSIVNTTQFHKLDFHSDIQVRISDVYGNTYKARDIQTSSEVSIYPGQMYPVACHIERPVDGVENFILHVFSGQKEICQTEFQAKDQDVAMSPDSDDIIVVYPKIFKTYHPGEKVFIELDFSKRAGKPDRLHILLDGHVFTDTNSQGRYEVNIPKENISDGLEIIVIGEWTQDASAPSTASKTIHIDVADNNVS